MTIEIFTAGLITYLFACKMHGPMPLWYAFLCYFIWSIALQLEHWYLMFEMVSVLGVVAIMRDLVKKGLA